MPRVNSTPATEREKEGVLLTVFEQRIGGDCIVVNTSRASRRVPGLTARGWEEVGGGTAPSPPPPRRPAALGRPARHRSAPLGPARHRSAAFGRSPRQLLAYNRSFNKLNLSTLPKNAAKPVPRCDQGCYVFIASSM